MNWFKRDPFIGALVVVTLLGVGLEAWFLYHANTQARQALTALDQKKRERDELQRKSPSPSETTERVVLNERVVAQARLVKAQSALTGALTSPVSPPSKPIDGYFEIVGFVEAMHGLATKAQVQLRPDERFGFRSYAVEGPATELLEEVFRQRASMQLLLETLFEARPTALLLVQRERPLTKSQRIQRAQTPVGTSDSPGSNAKSEDSADFFNSPPGASVRISGVIDVDAFRLEFSGRTHALREFLNRITTADLPFVVCSVETEPLVDSSTKAVASSMSAAELIPMVGQTISRFRVVLEKVIPLEESARPSS